MPQRPIHNFFEGEARLARDLPESLHDPLVNRQGGAHVNIMMPEAKIVKASAPWVETPDDPLEGKLNVRVSLAPTAG